MLYQSFSSYTVTILNSKSGTKVTSIWAGTNWDVVPWPEGLKFFPFSAQNAIWRYFLEVVLLVMAIKWLLLIFLAHSDCPGTKNAVFTFIQMPVIICNRSDISFFRGEVTHPLLTRAILAFPVPPWLEHWWSLIFDISQHSKILLCTWLAKGLYLADLKLQQIKAWKLNN